MRSTPATPTAPAGVRQQFSASGTYSDGTQRDITAEVTWTSNNEAIASISNAGGQPGLATTIGAGAATITATDGTVIATATFTVNSATLTSIAVGPSNTSLVVGASQQFTATGSYSDGSTLDLSTQVSWSSDTASVANISNASSSNGLAYAIAPGQTTISAADPQSSVMGSSMLDVTSAPR